MMNTKDFNSHQYERHLSPFAKIVLGNLIKILQERNESNKLSIVKDRYNYGLKKCVLNFDDTRISPVLNLCQRKVHANEIHFNNLGGSNVGSKEVAKSSDDTICNDLLKAAVSKNVNEKSASKIINAHSSPESVLSAAGYTVLENNAVLDYPRETRDHIEWDDIFDKQLFDDLNILDTEDANIVHKNVIKYNEYNSDSNKKYKNDVSYNEGKLNTEPIVLSAINNEKSECVKNIEVAVLATGDMLNLPIPGTSEEGSVTVDSKAQKNTDLSNNDKILSKVPKPMKKGKVKRQNSTKIPDTLTKKVKQSPADTNNSFRKQKYTKAVKNWLNSHKKFEDVMEFQSSKKKESDVGEQNDVEENHVKRTVQAQLTNKGGVMKYGVPKPRNIEKPKNSLTTTKGTLNSSSTIVNDKKIKPKFIPPIKSQIPVKDLSYTIVCLNDDTFKEDCIAVKGEDIEMILLFSNGFCQLNSHYTEDTCQVEGVMFLINDDIFYWNGDCKTFCSAMERLIKDNTIVCYDGKNLLKYFASREDIEVDGTAIKVLDVQIGANLIDPDNTLETFTDVQKMLSFTPEYTIATECVQQKSAWYTSLLRQCFLELKALLIDHDLWKVFVEIEMPVLPVIAEMEHRGVRVDTALLKSMEEVLTARLQATERACHAAAGRAFQLTSTPQVRAILYDELRLDCRTNVRVRETPGKGEKSTSETMLRSLMAVHPLPKLILEYRHVQKAHATFVAGIANQVKDGVVRPTWVQTAAATGRIASNNPNLQAIPKAPFSLTLFPPDGKEGEELTESNQILNFRSIYIPSDGYVLLAADFKHIECRVFAYAAADTSLLAALASPDLFTVLAEKWLGAGEAAGAGRERTKRLVYASLYGAGTRRLADILGLGYEQTLTVMASFHSTFPSLRSFSRGVVARCARAAGRLRSLGGRARHFRNIASADHALRSQAERQAVNFIVQGSAADVCKRAMCATRARLGRLRARLLLQIHDELVWEVATDDLPQAAAIIKSTMENIGFECGMAAALPVAVSAGPAWGDLAHYTPPSPSTDSNNTFP